MLNFAEFSSILQIKLEAAHIKAQQSSGVNPTVVRPRAAPGSDTCIASPSDRQPSWTLVAARVSEEGKSAESDSLVWTKTGSSSSSSSSTSGPSSTSYGGASSSSNIPSSTSTSYYSSVSSTSTSSYSSYSSTSTYAYSSSSSASSYAYSPSNSSTSPSCSSSSTSNASLASSCSAFTQSSSSGYSTASNNNNSSALDICRGATSSAVTDSCASSPKEAPVGPGSLGEETGAATAGAVASAGNKEESADAENLQLKTEREKGKQTDRTATTLCTVLYVYTVQCTPLFAFCLSPVFLGSFAAVFFTFSTYSLII